MATSPLVQSAPAVRPAIRGLWWKALTGLWLSAGIYATFALVGPARGFTIEGHGGKVIFFHVPCAWIASLAYVVGAWDAGQAPLYRRDAAQLGPAPGLVRG